MRVDKNVGADPDHRSPSIHDVEKLVAIVQINPRHDPPWDDLQAKNVAFSLSGLVRGQANPQGLVDDIAQRTVFTRRPLTRHLKNIIIERQCGPHEHNDVNGRHALSNHE